EFTDKLSIAAVNSPSTTVVSGSESELAELSGRVTDAGVFARWLPVEYAFHSDQASEASEGLRASSGNISINEPTMHFYSTVLGRRMSRTDVDADYWARGASECVHFDGAVAAMLRDGIDVAIEIGPHPVLRESLIETAKS